MIQKIKDSGAFIAVLFICVCIAISIRLIELPKWHREYYEIDEEKLMATHDAYFFLASAIKTGRIEEPIGAIIRLISELTNISVANIGFFMPAILSSLIVIPLVFLAYKEGIIESSFVASILASCCLGYLSRTRLGFLDTDMLMGLLVGFCCMIVIWLNKKQRIDNYLNIKTNIQLFLIGVTGNLYMWLYLPGRTLVLLCLFFALICSIVINKKQNQSLLTHLPGIALIFISCFDIWVGILTLITIISCFFLLKKRNQKIYYFFLILAVIITFFHSSLNSIVFSIISQILRYIKIPYTIAKENAPLYLPNTLLSVREAQAIKFQEVVYYIAQNWFIFSGGILGFVYLLIKRPSYGIFIPFIGLGIGAVKIGKRFPMYGGVVIGIGLGLGLGLFLKNLLSNKTRWIFQICISIFIIICVIQPALKFFPTPAIPKIYAKTFKELSEIAPSDARLWQWWDYGYACQYYAKRASFGDGGTSGSYLYILALVHMLPSAKQAAHIMKFITYSQIEKYKKCPQCYKSIPRMWKIYAPDPVVGIKKMNRHFKLPSEYSLPTQYLVFSWENLKLAYWISYFGLWDLKTGKSHTARIQLVKGKVYINLKDGFIIKNKQKIMLEGFIIINKNLKVKRFFYSHRTKLFGIFNSISKEFYLVDSTIFYSNMIQMLLTSPFKFKPYFKLVIDHFPWVRVYEVK